MRTRLTSRTALLVAIVVLAAPGALSAQSQSKGQQKCINTMNKDGAKVAATQGKEITSCIKNAGKGKESDPDACLTRDGKGKVAKTASKTEADYDKSCVAEPPDFGLAGVSTGTSSGLVSGTPGAVVDAAINAELQIAAGVFGSPLSAAIVTDKDGAKCQAAVSKDYEKTVATYMKGFLKCKKNTLKAGATSAAALEACVLDDPGGKAASTVSKLAADIGKKCGDNLFPGSCSAEPTGSLADCIHDEVRCGVCTMQNDMDGLQLNCDLLDDGTENGSCLNEAPRRSAGCGLGSFAPGTHPLTFLYDGVLRTYDVHVPASYDDGTATPLLLNLHPLVLGGGALHGVWTQISQQNAKSEDAGFIVLQPDGTGEPASWNGGQACCDPAFSAGVDDVGFIDALVAHTQSQLCIDERRVYSTGMSNGGYLSHRIACEHPERVAAIAPVVGSFSSELVCAAGRGMPVLQLSGSNDSLASRQASVDRWLTLNECTDSTTVTTTVSGELTCTTHDDCKDGVEVMHCVVDDGDHCAFTDADPPIVPGCTVPVDFAAQNLIWDFVSRWRLP